MCALRDQQQSMFVQADQRDCNSGLRLKPGRYSDLVELVGLSAGRARLMQYAARC